MKQRLLPALFILSLALFQACKKDRDEAPKEKETVGVYVLYQGSWPNNNSGIAYYNMRTGQTEPDYFKAVNGYPLGESGQDLQQYGNKIYCVVSGTQGEKKSFLEVIDPATGKSLKRISFNSETTGYMPRYITFYKNKAYVSAYDGKIRRVDTASLAIDGEVQAGGAMEGIAIANNKIYTANSDHILFPGVTKNTVSVVDIASFTKLKEINVSANPLKIVSTESGDVYVVSSGNYADILPAYQKISSQTDVVTATYQADISSLAVFGNAGYAITDPYSSPAIKSLNFSTGQLGSNFITDATSVTTPYGVTINTLNGDVVISDANNYGPQGQAFYFSADGKLSFKFATGANPANAVLVYDNKLKI